MVPKSVTQLYRTGEILKLFYDKCSFLIDFDLNGNLYELYSNTDYITLDQKYFAIPLFYLTRDILSEKSTSQKKVPKIKE